MYFHSLNLDPLFPQQTRNKMTASVISSFLIIKIAFKWYISTLLNWRQNFPPHSLTAVGNESFSALGTSWLRSPRIITFVPSLLDHTVSFAPTDLKQNDTKLFRDNKHILVMHRTALGDDVKVSHHILSQRSGRRSFSRPWLSLIVMITLNYDWLTDFSIDLVFLCAYFKNLIWNGAKHRRFLHISFS